MSTLGDSIVYARGGFCRYDEARVGLLTHGLQYGTGCFEGIRGYWNAEERELYLLQVRPHFERMADSARLLLMELPHPASELCEIAAELCVRNRFETDVYLRPVSYKDAEDVGVRLFGVPDAFAIVGIPFKKYFDAEAGLRACFSSWRRIDDTMAPARAKITGVYVNSALAKSEAQMNGFDEAILLSHDGHVSEASAANFFIVRDGMLSTPDGSQNILEGITRSSLIQLARERLGIEVLERPIDRSEVYGADEAFITGSAAGITFVASVDHRRIGDGVRGPITTALAQLYDRVVRGYEPAYRSWLTPAYANRRVEA